MFRFNDANIYWALYVLSDGRRMGRKNLSEEVGIGEGSMRRIIETLKEWNMISIKQTGITITKAGQTFLSQIPIRVVNVDLGDSVVGSHSQGIVVLGRANKIDNGMQQRDEGIRVGADGCTTVLIRDGSLMIPPDWNMDERSPELASLIRNETHLTEKDVLIVGSGSTRQVAIEAALNAAFAII